MITKEENDLLTQTGPGTPCGELMRRYWQPAALSEEFPPGGAPLPLRLLGEDLVLFRDEKGTAGLLDLHCPHRGADLSYGRLEDGGLRCIYHGWLFDSHGDCLDMPGEPDGGKKHRNSIRLKAYPCKEIGGLIFAYMGPGEPPLFPSYEIFNVPEDQRTADKTFYDCNYLQGHEGSIDPVHLSFLHRRISPVEGEGEVRVRGGEATSLTLYAKDLAPTLDVEVTDFGLRIATSRKIGEDRAYLRVSNYIFPALAAVPAGGPGTAGEGYTINWQVPIDDDHSWNYVITFNRNRPLTTKQREKEDKDANYVPVRNRANRYLQDRESMKTRSFSGIGTFTTMDTCAIETAGAIQDRTQENLASSDKAILACRKLLLKAIQDLQAGREPPHVIREPNKSRLPRLVVISEIIPSGKNWREHAREREAEVRV